MPPSKAIRDAYILADLRLNERSERRKAEVEAEKGPMTNPPLENEILISEPLEVSRGRLQVREAMCSAIEMLFRRRDADQLTLVIGSFYWETVSPGDLPTNDFISAVKRDLDTHGKLVVVVHPHPVPEGYQQDTDQCLLSAMAGVWETQPELRVILFGEEMLRATAELARKVSGDESD